MATFESAVRRGLPREPGGEPWPPAGVTAAATTVSESSRWEQEQSSAVAVTSDAASSPAPVADAPTSAAVHTTVRRGLPREVGGEPWPPLGSSIPDAPAAPSSATAVTDEAVTDEIPKDEVAAGEGIVAGNELRRGLPREAGGDAWPPAGTARTESFTAVAPAADPIEAPAADLVPAVASTPQAVAVPSGPRPPLTVPRTVWQGKAPVSPTPRPEPRRIGPFTRTQWAGATIVGGLSLLILAGMAVAFVRFILSFDALQDFLTTYPGEYHLPEGAPVGLPAWLGWQHFFNVFLMVLIIRSGLTIRTEKRPTAFWVSKRNPKSKTSLTIWFHQGLDLLWVVNGLVFVVLLFVTGQWMRIVPTSWEVFPNALSAALQYVSLDWPTENGWVNYNSLQQLAYFSTVFIAAPLAIISGVRMSTIWPKKNQKLSALYPIEVARKIHFPTMLFFIVFIVIHVALVFATGALRNLNHMYAAQGSVDGVAYADNWTGFWMFVLSLAAIAGAWVAARPIVLAPIARLFGTVSGR